MVDSEKIIEIIGYFRDRILIRYLKLAASCLRLLLGLQFCGVLTLDGKSRLNGFNKKKNNREKHCYLLYLMDIVATWAADVQSEIEAEREGEELKIYPIGS